MSSKPVDSKKGMKRRRLTGGERFEREVTEKPLVPPRELAPDPPPFTAFLYVLRCSDGSLYVGYTENPDRRMIQHALGSGALQTRNNLPVRLECLIGVAGLAGCPGKRQEIALRQYLCDTNPLPGLNQDIISRLNREMEEARSLIY